MCEEHGGQTSLSVSLRYPREKKEKRALFQSGAVLSRERQATLIGSIPGQKKIEKNKKHGVDGVLRGARLLLAVLVRQVAQSGRPWRRRRVVMMAQAP